MKKIHLKRKIKFFIFFVVICISAMFLIFLSDNIKSSFEKSKLNAVKIENLQKKIENLENDIEKANDTNISDDMSDEDLEKVARNDLGLAKNNEIILIPKWYYFKYVLCFKSPINVFNIGDFYYKNIGEILCIIYL